MQPVPTSVDIGPGGAYCVGELTGVTAESIFEDNPSTGLSRVWHIEPGARNVICPSDDCEVAIDNLTSVIDLAFGPDGGLYEYDANGWFAATELDDAAGGTIKSCDVDTGDCDLVEANSRCRAPSRSTSGGTCGCSNNIVEPMVRVGVALTVCIQGSTGEPAEIELAIIGSSSASSLKWMQGRSRSPLHAAR